MGRTKYKITITWYFSRNDVEYTTTTIYCEEDWVDNVLQKYALIEIKEIKIERCKYENNN